MSQKTIKFLTALRMLIGINFILSLLYLITLPRAIFPLQVLLYLA